MNSIPVPDRSVSSVRTPNYTPPSTPSLSCTWYLVPVYLMYRTQLAKMSFNEIEILDLAAVYFYFIHTLEKPRDRHRLRTSRSRFKTFLVVVAGVFLFSWECPQQHIGIWGEIYAVELFLSAGPVSSSVRIYRAGVGMLLLLLPLFSCSFIPIVLSLITKQAPITLESKRNPSRRSKTKKY